MNDKSFPIVFLIIQCHEDAEEQQEMPEWFAVLSVTAYGSFSYHGDPCNRLLGRTCIDWKDMYRYELYQFLFC